MTDTEVASYANNYPTATDTLVSSDNGSSYNSINAGGTLNDDNGHTGQWTFVLNTGDNASGQMRITWMQAGYGPWSMTSNWFSVASSGHSNYTFHEHDNGLGVTLSPGETGTFSNTQDASGNSNQSQSAIGSFNNFAFTFQQDRNGEQTSTWKSSITDAAAGTRSSSNAIQSKTSVSHVSMAGQNSNGLSILSNINVYQLTISYSADHGSDYGPGVASTGNMRFLSRTTVQIAGNSAAGTGQKQSSLSVAEWGTATSNGQTHSWGNPAGTTMSPPPVNLSWPQQQSPPPPPPPQAWGKSGNWLLDLPPQPVSGPPLIESTEAMLKSREQALANGQTPPPLTAGSAPVYGSDGNRTAQQALGEAAQLSVTMLSQYSGPVLGLGFNAAMTLGSVINGDAAGVVQFGGQLAMNALEIAALVNPCGLAAKGLAAYGVTVTGSQLFEPGGFTLKNFLLTSYNLIALFGACFTGDMLVDAEGGKKRADEVKVGDKLWSRSEFDPNGPLMLKEVEERFVRVTLVLNLRVAGQVLRTTGEHPFWVENRGRWLPAGELKVGDLLRTPYGSLVPVEAVEDSGQVETVYNWRIADYHTYYVSATVGGVSIWAHNADYNISTANADSAAAVNSLKEYARGVNAWLAANGPAVVRSTAGALRKLANAAARAERRRAARAGTPYVGAAGHLPDTAITGLANPPGWLDMLGNSNAIAGGGLSSMIGDIIDQVLVDGVLP